MRRRATAAVILALLLTGCSAWRGLTGEAEEGRLRVRLDNLLVEDGVASIHGTVTNGYAERVEGVRYVVTVRDKGDAERVIERYERTADTVIEPGGSAPMRLEVEGKSFGDKRFRIALAASPAALGGRPVPPPEDGR